MQLVLLPAPGPNPQWNATLAGPGAALGKFATPGGMAVDSATGELFVADSDNSRVQRLAPNGTVLAAWGSLGSSELPAPVCSLTCSLPRHALPDAYLRTPLGLLCSRIEGE